jgi:hypothetical protein
LYNIVMGQLEEYEDLQPMNTNRVTAEGGFIVSKPQSYEMTDAIRAHNEKQNRLAREYAEERAAIIVEAQQILVQEKAKRTFSEKLLWGKSSQRCLRSRLSI